MSKVTVSPLSFGAYQQISTRYDRAASIVWAKMSGFPRPCFTLTLLRESRMIQKTLGQHCKDPHAKEIAPVDFLVLDSRQSGVFNLGGDLEFFVERIRTRDREGLRTYARDCVDVLYANATGMGAGITTISLVRGEALGGGFEAALSSDVIIAERQARFGLPEILFNLFPGMGAFQLLRRRVNPAMADRLITSGQMYTAEELHEMGIVDAVVNEGDGEGAVYDYVRKARKSRNAMQAIRRVRNLMSPLNYDELVEVVEIWVDTAMEISSRDLRIMERLVQGQNRLFGQPKLAPVSMARSAQLLAQTRAGSSSHNSVRHTTPAA